MALRHILVLLTSIPVTLAATAANGDCAPTQGRFADCGAGQEIEVVDVVRYGMSVAEVQATNVYAYCEVAPDGRMNLEAVSVEPLADGAYRVASRCAFLGHRRPADFQEAPPAALAAH